MHRIVLLLCLAPSLWAQAARPPAEECAAMLLSPSTEWRRAGHTALAEGSSAEYRESVLTFLSRWAHSRNGWIAALEKGLDDSGGQRHVAMRRLLKILKDAGEDDIGVDIVLVDLPHAEAERLLGRGTPTVVFADSGGWSGWWKALGATADATVVFKSSMPGKESLDVVVERKRQISYVRDFEVKNNIGSPVVDTLETGAFVRWRPVVARNREYVTLHCSLNLIDIVRPIKVKEVPVAGGVKARIQVPEMHELEKRLSVTLPLGGCAAFVVGAGPGARAKHTTIAFVRATIGSPAGVPKLPLPEREVGQGIRRAANPK